MKWDVCPALQTMLVNSITVPLKIKEKEEKRKIPRVIKKSVANNRAKRKKEQNTH